MSTTKDHTTSTANAIGIRQPLEITTIEVDAMISGGLWWLLLLRLKQTSAFDEHLRPYEATNLISLPPENAILDIDAMINGKHW